MYGDNLNFLKKLSTILTHILPWTKTGTEPALDVLTTRAKPLSNAGQFVHVTELNVPTVLTQQAQKIGVAAIKNYGNQIHVFYHSIFAFKVTFLCPVFCV